MNLSIRKKIFFTAIVLAGFCLVSFVALEVSLRVDVSKRPPNDRRSWTWGHSVKLNRMGFRGREFVRPKPSAVFRVMVLGDSLTWGAGLPADERYTELLEERLHQVAKTVTVEVLNFGRPGGPTTMERDILIEHIGDVDPDLVVVGFCVNDPQPKAEAYAVEMERYRALYDGTRKLQAVGLKQSAEFFNLRLDRLLRNVGLVPDWITALDRTYDPQSLEWREFVRALEDIVAVSDGRSLPRPIFIPLLYGDGDFSAPDRRIESCLRWVDQASDAANAAGFQVVSVLEAFQREGNRVRWVNSWDGHPDAQCHRVYADALCDAIAPLISH